jgi:hypothetical protein
VTKIALSYIVSTFVNVTKYSQYNNNMIIKKIENIKGKEKKKRTKHWRNK